MKGQTFYKRLNFALHGMRAAFRRERSFRVHVLGGLVVLGALLFNRPPAIWWALGALAVGLVVTAELFNAALEALADRLHPERHPEIGVAKDIAASAVLAAVLAAVGVAIAFLLR